MTPFATPTGGKFKSGLVGYDPNSGRRVGSTGDVPGDIRLVGDKVYYCEGTYDGNTEIWFPTLPVTIGTGLSSTSNQNWEYTTNPDYPSGAWLLDSQLTISAATGGLPTVEMSGWTWLYAYQSRGNVMKYYPNTPNYTVYVGDYFGSITPGYMTTISNESTVYTMVLNSSAYGGSTINGMSSFYIAPRQIVQLYLTGSDYRTIGIRRPTAVIDWELAGGTSTIDARTGCNFRLLLNSNTILGNPSNMVNGDEFSFMVVQGSSWTLSYGTKFKWAGGVAPVITTGAGKIDLITARYNATNDILLCTITKDIR
jgi:hypothetical protein